MPRRTPPSRKPHAEYTSYLKRCVASNKPHKSRNATQVARSAFLPRKPIATHDEDYDKRLDILKHHVGALPDLYQPPANLDPNQPLTELPDGTFVSSAAEPGPIVPAATHLPGYYELEAEEEERKASGYILEPFERPIRLGKLRDDLMLVDGNAWSSKVNEHLDTISDAIPKAPFIWVFIGGIAKGKTTTIMQLLQLYSHPKAFKNCHIFSNAMILDPIPLSVMANRHPDTNIQIHTVAEAPSVISPLVARIRERYAKYLQIAKVGRFRKQDKNSLAEHMLQPWDHPYHPYTDDSGIHHGRAVRLPNYNSGAMAHLDPLTKNILLGRTCMETLPIPRNAFWVNHGSWVPNRFMGAHENLEDRGVLSQQPGSLPLHAPHLALNPFNELSPRRVQYQTLMESVIEDALQNPDSRAKQAKTAVWRTLVNDPSSAKRMDDEPDPTLLIFDDCAYAFSGGTKLSLTEWLPQIRHGNCCAIFIFHQVTSVPTIFRTIATHLGLFHIDNANEFERLKKEWGGAVPDFEGVYHAATVPVDTPEGPAERDFLQINLRDNTASRSLTGKLVTHSTDYTPQLPTPHPSRTKTPINNSSKEHFQPKRFKPSPAHGPTNTSSQPPRTCSLR